MADSSEKNSSEKKDPKGHAGGDGRSDGSREASRGLGGLRSRFFVAAFDVADQVVRLSKEFSPIVVEEVRQFAKHPRSLGNLIEAKSPWLNRKFLGVASNLLEPFLVGMGLKVEKLGEEVVEVKMPGIWRNQGDGGDVHNGALLSLGEFAVRLFWEYHLDVRRNEIQTKRVQLRTLIRPTGDMKAVFRLAVSEREAILYRIRSEGFASIETQTLIYDQNGRLVAEVEVDWELRRQLSLGSGSDSGFSAGGTP